MFKIALTAGHYKYESGRRCLKILDPNETREWELNNRIADKVEALLAANYTGYQLLRTDDTTGEKNVLLQERTDAANAFGADFYLSIHHNAGIYGGKGGGIMAYVYTYAIEESIAWQKALYDALIDATGLKGNRAQPLDKANFHECRETNMPAVLLELGFMDSPSDVPVILTEDYANKCADAIVKVLAQRGKLEKKADPVLIQLEVLRKGSAGPQPYAVQTLLNGFIDAGVAVDGDYGSQTEQAVEQYQKARGLPVTGKVDSATWTQLLLK